METAEDRITVLHKLYSATRFRRYRVNITQDDYRKEHEANTAIAILARHTAAINLR